MMAWALAWSCQKFGSFSFSWSAASCLRAEPSSKIAPHELEALLELGVASLEILDVFSHAQILHTKLEIRKSKLARVHVMNLVDFTSRPS
jgi:hypothetical protein